MSNDDIGSHLSKLREKSGLSIYKLAKLSGVSHSYISQIERGLKKQPSPDVLKKLAEPLGVESIELMEKAGHFDGLSHEEKQMVKERTSINHDFQANLLAMLEETLKVLTVDDVFFDFLKDDIQAVQERYSNYFDEGVTITPSELRELANNAEWDQEWIFNLIKEFVIIAKKHDLDFEEIAKKRKNEEQKLKEITDFLQQPNITYNGHKFNKKDRRLTLNYLDVLFSDRKEKE